LTSFAQRWLSILLILFSGSLIAAADTLTVGGAVSGTTLTIQDSALTALNSSWASGVTAYIDPYNGVLDGQSVLLFCIDPDHLDNTTPGYLVNLSQNGTGNSTMQQLNVQNGGILPQSGNLSNAAILAGFSKTNVPQLYGGLAWLSEQLEATSDSSKQQEIQAAIWQLGDYTSTFTVVNPPTQFGSTLGTCGLAQAVCSLETQAKTNALTSGFEIVTDASEAANGKNAGQEYLVLTPEPSSVLLSATGLFGIFLFRRRKMSVLK
jgi:hypothetical protein